MVRVVADMGESRADSIAGSEGPDGLGDFVASYQFRTLGSEEHVV